MEEGTEATDGDTMEMEDADEDGQDTPHRGKGVRRRAPLSYRANVDATRYFTSQVRCSRGSSLSAFLAMPVC